MNDATGQSDEARAAAAVFVSYSRADQKRALPVIKLLEGAGFRVWWDGLLEGGDSYLPTTEAALTSADAVVVLWSATSVNSNWVRDEAMSGRERHCLVPLSIDGSEPPLGFRQFQVIDVAKWRGRQSGPDAERILRAVRMQVAHTPVEDAAPGKGFHPSRRMIMGGAAAAGLAAVAGGWAFWPKPAGGQQNASVAVIPFRNLSGDAAQDYLSDGFSEEVRTVLAQNPLLKVVAQSSVRTFREGEADAPSMAKELGVGFVLTGSLRKAGATIRITTRLTEGADGHDVWTQSFDRPLDDLLLVQTEIANRVADALTAHIGSQAAQEARRASRSMREGGTRIVAALDAFLQGQSLYYFGVNEAEERAGLAKFDEAVALDPRYAAAHAARARAIPYLADNYGKPEDLLSSYQSALDAARLAVRLAPDMAEGHSALGYLLHSCMLDAKAAKAPFERSLELAPGDEPINSFYARYCALTQRDAAAMKSANLALSLSPLDASVHRAMGRVHFAARRYGQALGPLQQSLAMSPGLSGANTMIGTALHLLGRTKEALDYHRKEPSRVLGLTGQAIVLHALGQGDEARATFKTIVDEFGTHALYQQAQILAQWGDAEAAITRLQQAYPKRDSGLVLLLTDPMLDPVRKDARVKDLLSRMGMV